MRARFDPIGKSQKVASREALFDTKQRERRKRAEWQAGRKRGETKPSRGQQEMRVIVDASLLEGTRGF